MIGQTLRLDVLADSLTEADVSEICGSRGILVYGCYTMSAVHERAKCIT